MKLWESVERTDPKYVKAITGKSYKGSSPSPYYLVRKATETFGPCGVGWGFFIVDDVLLDGADGTKIHHAKVRVWYNYGGETGASVEHVGQTVFCGKRRDGTPFTDEDAPKKSVTDALTKALSMLGFAGDIFSGRWDDSKYQAELKEEFNPKPLPKHPPPLDTNSPLDDVKEAKPDMTPQEWFVAIEAAKSYPLAHLWDECLEWWSNNTAFLDKVKEKDNLAYAAILNGFRKKKTASQGGNGESKDSAV